MNNKRKNLVETDLTSHFSFLKNCNHTVTIYIHLLFVKLKLENKQLNKLWTDFNTHFQNAKRVIMTCLRQMQQFWQKFTNWPTPSPPLQITKCVENNSKEAVFLLSTSSCTCIFTRYLRNIPTILNCKIQRLIDS